jgi:hypothetical protein
MKISKTLRTDVPCHDDRKEDYRRGGGGCGYRNVCINGQIYCGTVVEVLSLTKDMPSARRDVAIIHLL